MSFEQTFFHGYEKFTNHFDKWCEKSRPVLGKVTQCGIIEADSQGHAFIAINRPDFGEKFIDKHGFIFDKRYSYAKNLPEGFLNLCSNEGVQFLQNNEESIFGKTFDLWHGFSFAEKIDEDTYRYYTFSSDTTEIYDKLTNNINLVKKFIHHFKQDNIHVIEYFKERKFDVSAKKDNYFVTEDYQYVSEKDRLVATLHALNVLDQDKNITEREWQCLQLYHQGKSANQTGDLLGISRRTVESHFNNLKNKLNVNSKSELIDTII
ncbi:MAG: helix-turn-helix domain-containing protein [Legionellales bacterium]|nr:helix-turn-helix domain-containing protein [Legionellales bacterium]